MVARGASHLPFLIAKRAVITHYISVYTTSIYTTSNKFQLSAIKKHSTNFGTFNECLKRVFRKAKRGIIAALLAYRNRKLPEAITCGLKK